MSSSEEKQIAQRLREAIAQSRGYADFFNWGPDRDLEEWGVVTSLNESLKNNGHTLYTKIKSRGRPNDPPDCEAENSFGERVAIEVTELVDEEAIKQYKGGDKYIWAGWRKESFLGSIHSMIARKDSKFDYLHGAPYPGGYDLIIYTGEPGLNLALVSEFLDGSEVPSIKHLSKIFLLLSYETEYDMCPYIQLAGSS